MLNRHELIGRATELAPVFQQRALAEESLRAPMDETIADLVDSGLLATLTPKSYGGHEQPLDVMGDIVRIISAACPSTGWITAFYIGAAWRSLVYPQAGQRALFGDRNYVLAAGTAAPIGKVERAAGGYIINGRSAWNSGSVHADWFSFTGLLMDEGAPPQMLVFIVPRAEVTVHDNWRIAGMKGTGSNDVSVDRIFVPQERCASFSEALAGATPGQALHANPVYHVPVLCFTMAEVVPVLVGAMRGAADAFLTRAQERQGTISGVKASAKQAAQMRLARALASADAAETLFGALMARFDRPIPDQLRMDARVDFKMASAYITDLCRNAVNDIARGIGGDGFRDESVLQRYFRDVNTLAVHAFLDIDTASETAGRFALGLPVEDPLV